MQEINNFLEAMQLVKERPQEAADKIESFAHYLLKFAQQVRKLQGRSAPPTDRTGIGDQVRMNVVGPDGKIIRTIDTRKQSP